MINVYFPTFNAFIISLALYIALAGFIIYKAADAMSATKRYTDTKDAFMDVVLISPERADTIMSPKSKITNKDQNEIKEAKIAKKQEQITTNKATQASNEPAITKPEPISAKSLFDDIKIKQNPEPKKAVQSNTKSFKQNSAAVQTAIDKINALQDSDKIRAPKHGLKGEFDEFNGAVTRLIESRWQRYRTNTNDRVVVRLSIDENGRLLAYNFITRSYDLEFQSKARDLLENLKFVNFPIPPNRQKLTFTVGLSDKLNDEISIKSE